MDIYDQENVDSDSKKVPGADIEPTEVTKRPAHTSRVNQATDKNVS